MATLPLIQSVAGSITAGTTANATFPKPVLPGSAIVVAVGSNQSTMNSPTDTQGNTYASASSIFSTIGSSLKIAVNAVGGPLTVTQTTGSGNSCFICMEFGCITRTSASKIEPSGGAIARGNVASASVTIVGSFTTTQPEDLMIGTATNNGSATFTIGANQIDILTTANGTMNLSVVYRYLAPQTITNPTIMTQSSSSVAWSGSLASFLTTQKMIVNTGTRPHPFSPGIAR